ncbi:hypothetical protein [Streptomyces sp. NPDC051162]|uniref:hypothetical protein n=1 Tax=Streptomyces sp. NPDC051162 TaxID=3154747 RepID=UPI00343A4796
MPLLHFDLDHLSDTSGLLVEYAGVTVTPAAHTAKTRNLRDANRALRSAPLLRSGSVFTHFVNLPDPRDDDPAIDGLRWVKVTRPGPGTAKLREVVLIAPIFPERQLEVFFRTAFRMPGKPYESLVQRRSGLSALPAVYSGKLAWLGFHELSVKGKAGEDDALAVLRDAQTLITPMDTAAGLVGHYADLASTDPYTATVVHHDHILPDPEVAPDQYNAMSLLAKRIREAGDSWSPVVPCEDHKGNPLTAEYALGDIEVGDTIHTYDVEPAVLEAAGPAVAGACRTAADDPRLRRRLWSRSSGTSTLVTHRSGATAGESGEPSGMGTRSPATEEAGAGSTPAYKWTLDQRTEHHGVSVALGGAPAGDTLRVDVCNDYLRTLYAGYQLFGAEGGTVGKVEGLSAVSAVNTVLGIPMPTDPHRLEVPLADAASVEFLFGSFGTSDWVGDVSTNGAVLTALWQYAVPVFCLAAGAAITHTSLYHDLVSDPDLYMPAIALFIAIAGGSIATGSALYNFKYVTSLAAKIIGGLLLRKGMEKLGKWLVKQVAVGTVSQALGPLGWTLRLCAVALNASAMAVTTCQILSSPACVRVRARRALDVAVTVLPDERHGEAGKPETAVWPALARRYEATLVYEGGTTRKVTGAMAATTNSTPLKVRFDDVPAGGRARVHVGVYSDSGWLTGAWQSDWFATRPTSGHLLDLGSVRITEHLVPLAGSTQYRYKEKIAYQDGRFSWRAGDEPPTATRADLDCQGRQHLCEVVSATLNNSAQQIGYLWRASGQHLPPDHGSLPGSDEQLYVAQNLSLLEDPDSRLRRSDVGLTQRPALGYAAGTKSGKAIDPDNYLLDPRGDGEMHLRRVALDSRSDLPLALPGPSWGRFPLPSVDALVVHPDRAVLAASWRHHKLMILQLPETPSEDDSKAPVAVMVGGEGISAGLLRGPKAMAVAPDGRILVLESLNNRVQAFDTKGNPVPSFTTAPPLGTVRTADVRADLDAGTVPEVVRTVLRGALTSVACRLGTEHTAQLDKAAFEPRHDPLIGDLGRRGVHLAYDPERMGDPEVSAQIAVIRAGAEWRISDPRHFAWDVRLEEEELWVYRRITRYTVEVQEAGRQWLVRDADSTDAWKLAPARSSSTGTDVLSCTSFFGLATGTGSAVTYLDLAVEAQGHIYVLSAAGPGAASRDYVLGVYGPDGRFLFRSPDTNLTRTPQNIAAGAMAVDIWRSLYAVGYETLFAQQGTPQPTVAHWVPTPPLFSLPLGARERYDDRNISAIAEDFSARGIDLSNDAYATVVAKGESWEVRDGPTVYRVYRTAEGLQVYDLPV